ncbi:MAG: helix-turn-helix domain-containing protein [Burkholderiaceae bacterium]|nr:helix-turn-helix domain-containing protein [Burkholderiaceae bacterium]
MKIVVLGFEGCLPSGIVGLVDMFWLAGQAAQRPDAASGGRPTVPWPVCEIMTASVDGRPLHDGRGRPLAVDAGVLEIEDCDAVLIPGLVPGADGLPPRTAAMQQAASWLRQQHARGALVGGSCAGVFVLGEAGLLDGRRCTTTWWLHEELTRRYPRADVAWASALLEDQGVLSAGGPMSWVDLALHTIRKLAGPEAARLAANFAVVDNAPTTQTVYAPQRYMRQRDPLLVEAEQAVRQATPGFTAVELARQLSVSERTLHRRLKALVNESPKGFITRIRLEMARTLLDGQGASIKRVAQQCGYEDESSFRRAFQRFTGMSPSAYRSWAKQRQGGRTP